MLPHCYCKTIDLNGFNRKLRRDLKQNPAHIYVFDFLELVLQVFGQLVRAFYRTPLAGQVGRSIQRRRHGSGQQQD